MLIRKVGFLICLMSSLSVSTLLCGAESQKLDSVIETGKQRNRQSQDTQKTIDQLDDSIHSKLSQFRQINKEADGLDVYIAQLQRQIAAQETEVNDVKESLRQVVLVERHIMPLMLKMLDSMAEFIELDLPFQTAPRRERVDSLRSLLDRPDITVSEKYRKVLELYQDEIGYGKTIEAYRGKIDINGSERDVDFLRIGRIALFYSTLDGNQFGNWDERTKQWNPLGAEYRSTLVKSIRIAREQMAPDLIRIPLPAAVAQMEAAIQ